MKRLWAHQAATADAALTGLTEAVRAKIIAACGPYQTLIGRKSRGDWPRPDGYDAGHGKHRFKSRRRAS
jgi:hypothetical protein